LVWRCGATSGKLGRLTAVEETGERSQPRRRAVLIVDDHPLVREALAELLDREPDLVSCARAGHSAEALAALERASPDVAVIDLSLAGGSGLDLIREIQRRRPGLPVVVVSMLDERVYGPRALRAGANGYVMKLAEPEAVISAIRTVASGDRWISAELAEQLELEHTDERAGLDALTEREFQVFELVGRGLTTRAISVALGVSVKTIETHRQRIKEKLALHSGADLVHFAIRWAEHQAER
jgi:DNA-binding NarL/FixJ family response regulator